MKIILRRTIHPLKLFQTIPISLECIPVTSPRIFLRWKFIKSPLPWSQIIETENGPLWKEIDVFNTSYLPHFPVSSLSRARVYIYIRTSVCQRGNWTFRAILYLSHGGGFPPEGGKVKYFFFPFQRSHTSFCRGSFFSINGREFFHLKRVDEYFIIFQEKK